MNTKDLKIDWKKYKTISKVMDLKTAEDFKKSFLNILNKFSKKGLTLMDIDNLIIIIEREFISYMQDKLDRINTKAKTCPKCGDGIRGIKCGNCGYRQTKIPDFFSIKS